MDSCSKQQGRNIIFTNNKQTNNFSINSIKQQDLTTMNKTFTKQASTEQMNSSCTHLVEAMDLWSRACQYSSCCLDTSQDMTKHNKTRQDKTRMKMTEIEEVTCMTVTTTETYLNVYSFKNALFFLVGMFVVIITN